MSKNPN